MDGGHELGHPEVLFVVLHEELACFVVEAALRDRHDQQAGYGLEDSSDAPLGRVPVLLQSVDTNLSLI